MASVKAYHNFEDVGLTVLHNIIEDTNYNEYLRLPIKAWQFRLLCVLQSHPSSWYRKQC